ncbi:carbohydrate sulfotransferase 14-like isoform X2 [Asterias rubens]|uniref:carbohydrate sulfotransferase 14-like isoform X2 n=1 Tax=Asterias rubens TaxID=7604 RepID=UPI001455811C|nr:carbohydrate sulfotransferase 14-like isoform X2 [Asterias rubens]
MSNKTLRNTLTWFTFVVASAVVFVLGIFQGWNPDRRTTYYVYDGYDAAPPTTPPVLLVRRRGGATRENGGGARPLPVGGNKVRELHSKSLDPGFASSDGGPSEFRSDYVFNETRGLSPPGSINTSAGIIRELSKKITRSIRNHTLQSICRAEEVNDVSMLDRGQRDLLARQIIVDDKRKFLYCYVPKVACSNWKRVIKFMQGTIDDIGTRLKMDHKNGLVFLDSFSEKEINYRIKNYYKFMFVRNPMERLLSAYRNKFGEVALSQYKDRYAPRIIHRYRGEWDGKSNNITLEEFIRFVIDSRTRTMDQHWKPMHLLCHPCAMQYDFVGSFEQLNADADFVLDKIKGDTGAYFPRRQDWYNPTTEEKMQNLIKDVDPVYIQQFVDKFILDFITFGYAPPKQYYLKHNQPENEFEEEDLIGNEIDNDVIPRGSDHS